MNYKTICSAFIFSLVSLSSANAAPKYPMALIWDNEVSQNLRNELLQNPSIKSDLQVAYDGYVASQCYSKKDYKACLDNPPKPPFSDVFYALSVATPDLNNDGKRDLILYLGGDTGLSGAGNCGIMEVWFYQNTGNDYRNIGKEEFLKSEQFFLGKPKPKGQFRDIITKEATSFCSGKEPIKFYSLPYNYKKRAYFDLTIDAK